MIETIQQALDYVIEIGDNKQRLLAKNASNLILRGYDSDAAIIISDILSTDPFDDLDDFYNIENAVDDARDVMNTFCRSYL